jgi:hypothetical protein
MATKNDTNAEKSETGKEIQASVNRAQVALNRLDNVTKRQAQHGRDPTQTGEYWDRLLDVDMAIMDCFGRMRKYLKLDLEDYWNTYVIGYDNGVPVILGAEPAGDKVEFSKLKFVGQPPAAEIPDQDSVVYLEDFQGATKKVNRTVRERFGEPKQETQHIPKVLDPDDYHRTVRILDEARRKLGFTPTPTESAPRTEITDEMVEEVEEWRQQNLE